MKESIWIYAACCRNCGNKNVWVNGTSENVSGVSFVEAMKDKLLNGTNKWCEKCKASIIHDIIFYGDQKDYQHLIDQIIK